MPGRRIVLLEMASEDAEEFVRDVVNRGADEATIVPTGATVEAVVARPTVWCKCDVPTESRSQRRRRQSQRREGGWSRGAKLGWWLCAHCRKPSKAIVQHWITNMLAGANDLLPPILGAGEAITPGNRWLRDGGAHVNSHADVQPAMPFATGPARRRKIRRSEVDLAARNAK